MNKKLFGIFLTSVCLFSFACGATGIDQNTAKMQAMDKITGRVSVIHIPVGGAVNFGSLSIAVRACKTRPAEETPDNFAFVDIADKTLQGKNINIFRGWMISSSPATSALEHPIYDVWLLQCADEKIDKKLLLTQKQFVMREAFPMVRNTSSPAKTLKPLDSAQPSPQMKEMNEEENHQQQLMPTIEFSYDEAEETEESDEQTEENTETNEPLDNQEADKKDENQAALPSENTPAPEQ